ncbi:MAG: hypothetical protein AW09_003595 [Candidatus Accumulibacter phosphatis]|uniref:Uncharacterized protein n=1 Tax=Candidatus Accumulibacter phosphatis TaxID=327160 RepID=A0A080LSB9_9PROT|nr:MAG: hypothetical protein AW09_003595 [Candidatus Accumulibacter phosphatis]
MLDERPEGAARADFQKQRVAVAGGTADAIGKAYGMPQVPGVIRRVAGLRGAEPGAAEVGDHRQARRLQRDRCDHGGEALEDRLHHRRMESVRGVQQVAWLAASIELLLAGGDCLGRSGKDAAVGRVDPGQRQTAGFEIDEGAFRQVDGEHAASRHLLHQAAARGHQPEGVGEAHHFGQAERGVLADAVADHRRRADAPTDPQARQCVFDDKQRRLDDPGLLQRCCAGLASWPDQAPKILAKVGDQDFGAAVHLRAEQRLGVVQLAPHSQILGALAGEHENHGPVLPFADRFGTALAVAREQRLYEPVVVAADQHAPVREAFAAGLQGERDVGEGLRRIGAQMIGKTFGHAVEGAGRACRQEDQLPGARCAGGGTLWGLLEQHVCIGSAETEGADTRAADRLCPLGKRAVHVERAVGKVDFRVRPAVVQRRGNAPMLEHQRGLDQPGDARGDVHVADVGLHRANRAVTLARAAFAKGLGERLYLDRVAHWRAGAVRFDVADGVGRQSGHGQSLDDHGRLAADAGSGVADLGVAVVVHRRALDHGVDVVAVGEGVGETLERDDAGTAAEHRAAGIGVESPAVPVGGIDAAFLVEVADPVRNGNRDATGQRQIALAVEQALTGDMHRHQRGRASGLDVDARAGEVELVGDTGGQVVLVVADLDLEVEQRRCHVRAGGEVVDQVAVHRRAGENADGTTMRGGGVAGAFEGFPGAFEEDPLLRFDQAGLARAVTEKGSVEAVDVVDHRTGANVGRVGEEGGVDACGEQLGFGEEADRFDPLFQVAPENGNVIGVGEAAAHADDCNVVGVGDGSGLVHVGTRF